MARQVLSADMRAQMPQFELKTKVTRTHEETMVHPIFRWMREKITVVDHIQFVGIVITQAGISYEIPLQGLPVTTESDQG